LAQYGLMLKISVVLARGFVKSIYQQKGSVAQQILEPLN